MRKLCYIGLLKLAGSDVPFMDTYSGRIAVSSAGGALLAALYELSRRKGEKSHWARSLLNGVAGGALVGAGTLGLKRGVYALADRGVDGEVRDNISKLVDESIASVSK